MRNTDWKIKYIILTSLIIEGFLLTLILQIFLEIFGLKEIIVQIIRSIPIAGVGASDLIFTYLLLPFIVSFFIYWVLIKKDKSDRELLRNWNNECFKKWAKINYVDKGYVTFDKNPEEFSRFIGCKHYLKVHYPSIFKRWIAIEELKKDINKKAHLAKINVRKYLEENLRKEYPEFDSKKDFNKSHYLTNSFLNVILDYQYDGDKVLQNIDCIEYNNQFKVFLYESPELREHPKILVFFNRVFNEQIIKEKLYNIIKYKNYKNLTFDGGKSDLQTDIHFFKEDMKVLTEKIDDNRELIYPWWIARHEWEK